jgi:hypothetical protein
MFISYPVEHIFALQIYIKKMDLRKDGQKLFSPRAPRDVAPPTGLLPLCRSHPVLYF